jgi:hypothetical protein
LAERGTCMPQNTDILDGKGEPHSPIPEELLLAELKRVLESVEVRSSHRCQEFLQFVVEETLKGRADTIKERTIGIEVFGRQAAYNTDDDATVRTKATEVRKRLALYYAGSGKNDPVRIHLPVGSYIPTFSEVRTSKAAAANVPSEVNPGHKNSKRVLWWSVVLVVIVALALGGWRLRPAPSVIDQFWNPFFVSSTPVMIAASYAPVDIPIIPGARSATTGFPSDKGFTFIGDQFVGGGDLIAAGRLTGMFGGMGRRYNLRIGNTISFADLSNTPAILIGYASTRWSDVSQGLRYFVDDKLSVITDNGKPTAWGPKNLTQDLHATEDYAIVSRSYDPQTHAMLVIVSGCTGYGTQAAAELVTNNELLTEALRGAPKGWQNKNLQLVIHLKIISGSPASPSVVASHYW